VSEESIRHALTGYVYTRQDDGHVRVVDPPTGRSGLFDSAGNWVSGELTYVDHHMLGHMRAARAGQPGVYGRKKED
jgi:hypothetical protein